MVLRISDRARVGVTAAITELHFGQGLVLRLRLRSNVATLNDDSNLNCPL